MKSNKSKIKSNKKKILKKSLKKKSNKKKNNSLFFNIHNHVKKIFNKTAVSESDLIEQIKNINLDDLKKERIDYISNFHKEGSSIIKKLYLDRNKDNNCTITTKKTTNTIGAVEYTGYNFIDNHLTKPKNGIALGTWFNNNDCKTSLVNIYKSKVTVNSPNGTPITVENTRLGTAASCTDNANGKKVLKILSPGKKIINLSLLSHCVGSCNITSNLLGHGALSKIKEALVYEPVIIKQLEQINEPDFITVFFPMASRKNYKVVDINNSRVIKEKNENMYKSSGSNDPKLKKFIDLIDLERPYESLIKAFIYYYLFLKNDYVMNISCRSSKDRSSIVECFFKSVMTSMVLINPSGSVDVIYDKIIDKVEKWFPEFLKIGIVISYYSTGLYGLKMKHSIMISDIKRILGSRYEDFLGLQKFIK